MLEHYQNIESAFNNINNIELSDTLKESLNFVIDGLNKGTLKVVEKKQDKWNVNITIKKAILLFLKLSKNSLLSLNCNDDNSISYFDKIHPKHLNIDESYFKDNQYRALFGSIVRNGSFIDKNAVLMPSFINIGAYVGKNTMIDTWATIGSCAYIGDNCHISGGVGIGGVLEPLQANPVIIEDNCFIGARSEIAEGVIVKEGSVISMGVFIGASTKIVNRDTGVITYNEVPPYSVVVPGTLASKNNINLACAVIVKTVDEKTRSKTSINALLRE